MNEAGNKDPLWSHFHPLWTDLSRVASDDLLVAGGYGLYLKQRFLLANPALPIAVPLDRWLDATPRVTKDLDLVLVWTLLPHKNAIRAFWTHWRETVSALVIDRLGDGGSLLRRWSTVVSCSSSCMLRVLRIHIPE
jgi:hypothetical protein